MIFQVEGHIQKILSGEKTQTRRRLHDGDVMLFARDGTPVQIFRKDKLKYQVGKTYSIQAGRGKKGIPERIETTAIRKERVSDISESDAIAEGGYTPGEYLDLWQKMYKVDPAEDWCWVLTFVVVCPDCKGSTFTPTRPITSGIKCFLCGGAGALIAKGDPFQRMARERLLLEVVKDGR